MPGLLRGIMRTAVVAGTASAVAGRVQRHQARKFADRDAQTAADREQAYEEQMASPEQAAPQAPGLGAPVPLGCTARWAPRASAGSPYCGR